MCGIAGFWNQKASCSSEKLHNTVKKMRDVLISRGPDGADNWIDVKSGIAFGHRRLAVLDLSKQGSQPMESNRFVIAFNGEIYNHQELKRKLQYKYWHGYSDTEVILQSFEKWGIADSLKKFVGMFAIALWDKQKQQLFLMRDRIGEKPVYYGWLKDDFVFGSEINSLKKHFSWNQSIDPNAVDLFMQYNYIPAPYTIYKDIKKLQPGHYIIVNKNRCIQDFIYWKLQPTSAKIDSSLEESIDQLQDKLRKTIQLQMVADVSVGAFLSGGIDSSTIVAIMQESAKIPVKTFTIGFNKKSYNEAEHAKSIAHYLGTDHNELYVTAQQVRDIIPEIPLLYNEPFSDSSQVPTYIVSKLTKSQVTVSLSGDGGDELFAGYNRYLLLPKIWNKVVIFPKSIRVFIAKLLLLFSPKLWNKVLFRISRAGDKLHKLAGILDVCTPEEMYQRLISHWNHKDIRTLDCYNLPLVEKMMYLDMLCYLPNDILTKVDRATMAVSLENRVPFLDHRIVEYAWSLPLKYKIHKGQTKFILRKLLQRYIPKQLFEREKMGFSMPIDEWLRGPLKSWAIDLLAKTMFNKHKLLDRKIIMQKWDEHQSGYRNWDQHLWDVLMFQQWYEINHG